MKILKQGLIRVGWSPKSFIFFLPLIAARFSGSDGFLASETRTLSNVGNPQPSEFFRTTIGVSGKGQLRQVFVGVRTMLSEARLHRHCGERIPKLCPAAATHAVTAAVHGKHTAQLPVMATKNEIENSEHLFHKSPFQSLLISAARSPM